MRIPSFIFALLCVFAAVPSISLAERANLFINAYGLNPSSDWTFDVKIIAGADQLERDAELTQQPVSVTTRTFNAGVQVQLSNIFFQGADAVSLISLVAYQQDAAGARTIELFFPVHLLRDTVANGRNITFDQPSMRGVSESALAARRSFPFRTPDDEAVDITNDSLVIALNAVREIAKRPDLNEAVWSDIFYTIQTNSSLIAQRNDVLRKIVDILNEYKEVNQTDAFAQFYFLFLRKMVQEQLGERIRLNDSALINDYFRDEVSSLARSHPQVAYAEMNDMLEAFESAKNYERCIRVADAFQRGITQSVTSAPDWWRAQSSRTLAAEIYNGLIAGTRCAQLSYAENVDDGARSDVDGGAAYTVTVMPGGAEYATSFIELVAAFKAQNILTMDRDEIAKFDFFYTFETRKALGL